MADAVLPDEADGAGEADEVAGRARLEAMRARRTHPATLWFGPAYGVMEQVEAGWRMSAMSDSTPQAARDGLGWWFRVLARRRSTPEADREAYWEASALLERERLDELAAAGRRFRVVRADRFFRYGLSGPEQPRRTDADTVREPRHDSGELLSGGLLGPGEQPGGAALLGERWEVVPQGTMVPPDVTRDARRALRTHPRVALLAPRYAVAEESNGDWPRVPVPSARPTTRGARWRPTCGRSCRRSWSRRRTRSPRTARRRRGWSTSA